MSPSSSETDFTILLALVHSIEESNKAVRELVQDINEEQVRLGTKLEHLEHNQRQILARIHGNGTPGILAAVQQLQGSVERLQELVSSKADKETLLGMRETLDLKLDEMRKDINAPCAKNCGLVAELSKSFKEHEMAHVNSIWVANAPSRILALSRAHPKTAMGVVIVLFLAAYHGPAVAVAFLKVHWKNFLGLP